MRPSVDVPEVTAVGAEPVELLARRFRRQPAMPGDDAGERGVHIGRHTRRVTADIKNRPILDPFIQQPACVRDALLDIDSLPAIARESEIDAGENALLERALPLELVEEVLREMPRAEDEPVTSTRARRRALLDEGAVRRDAGARADHDQVPRGVSRQAEAGVGFDVNGHGRLVGPGRKEMACCARAAGAVAAGVDAGDGQVHFVLYLTGAGRDRVEAGSERSEGGGKRRGVPVGWIALQQVDKLYARDQRAQRLLLSGLQQG